MPIDPSIITNGLKVAPPTDPAQTALRYAALQNYMNENRMFSARSKMGALAQAAIEGGEFNPIAFGKGVAGGGEDVAPAALEGVEKQQTLQQQQQTRRAALLNVMGSGVTGLLNQVDADGNPKPATPEDVAALGQSYHTTGIYSDADLARFKQNAPPPGTPPDQVRAWLQQRQREAIAAQAQLPKTGDVDQGINRQAIQTDPVSGRTDKSRGSAANLELQPAPGFREPLLTWERPDGTKGQGYKADFDREKAAGTVQSGPTITAPGQPGPARPAAPAGAGGAPAASPAVIPAPVHPGVVTAPTGTIASRSPEATKAAEGTVGTNLGQEGRLVDRADSAPTRRGQYTQLLMDIDGMRTGPLHEHRVKAEGMIRQVTGMGITMSEADLAKGEAALKTARQIALGQADAMGGTDQSQRNAFGANPGPWLSNAGVRDIAGQLQGNEDAIEAKARAWQAYRDKHGSGTYDKFQQDFNKDFDPLAYQYRYYGPEVRAKLKDYFAKNPDAERRFWFGMDNVKRYGAAP